LRLGSSINLSGEFMFKRTKISTGVLLALGGALLAPLAAQAQEAQRIEVTGSRIRSVTADSASPLQVITAQDIAKSGAVNLQELLVKNPALGSLPTFSRTNSNFDVANSGVTTVDLRNLGEERTLVLVNGKRFVAGVPGSSAVDLNAIPTDFIERIELLTGGASSTYGSDAVAGVINIILKKDYEGVVLDASIGQADRGDDKKQKIGITWGANAAGGKGNVMLHFGYSKQGAVYSRDRDGLATDNISNASLSGEVKDVFSFTTPFFSSFTPQGRVFYRVPNPRFGEPVPPGGTPQPEFLTANRTFDRDGNVIPYVGATSGFNRQAFRTIAIPTERYMFAGKGDFEIAQDHRAYIEATYVTTTTKAVLEPFPMDSVDAYPATGGNVPVEFLVNGSLVRNPLVPDGIYNLLSRRNADGALVINSFSRRLSEVGNRGSDATTDTFRVASGVKGTLAKSWDYDVYGIYGVSKRVDISGGQFNAQSFRQALEAIPDTDDVNGNGNVTEAICRDPEARAQGCVPISIYGFGSISPGALNWIQAPANLNTFVTQKIVGASATGEVFQLPAGPIGLAFGGEYRAEYSRSEFDALQQTGLNGGNVTPRTEGGFNVKEAFIETRVPILKNVPLARALSVSGAVRAGKYSTVGNTVSWNAGMEWALNPTVKFRFTRALSTRAPNIGELFQPPVEDFPAVIDPCLGVTATSTDSRSVACRAAPGVNANIAANGGTFALNQADLQGTAGLDGGNPALDEEKGRSTTLGIVVTPTGIPWLSNTTFTADYFRIKIADAIVATPRQFILSQCYGGDASFCQYVVRRPAAVGANSAGSLEFVNTTVSNSGGYSTEGLDFTAGWQGQVGPGRLNSRLSWTYTKKGELIPLPGSAPDPFAGEVGTPKNKATLALGYDWGPWGVNTQFSYLGKQYLDDQWVTTLCTVPTDDDGNCVGNAFAKPKSVSIKAKTYADMQLTYTMGKFQYYLGIDNLFDTRNQRCDTNALIGGENGGCSTGTGTFAGDDPIGRRYYVGLRANF
jgi:iron complex outermembrane recepter protein